MRDNKQGADVQKVLPILQFPLMTQITQGKQPNPEL
jgi:hypothetical protein